MQKNEDSSSDHSIWLATATHQIVPCDNSFFFKNPFVNFLLQFVDFFWCFVALFARALSQCNIKDLITNVGSAAAAPAAAGAAPVAAAAGAPAKEEKKEEAKKEESESEDEDMGFGGYY